MPLGETNVEFYRNIYNGQRNSFRPPQQVQPDGPIRHQNEQSEIDEPRWPCHICTFRNHPLMNKCEQCEMPRILLGNLSIENNDAITNQNSQANNQSNNPLLALGMNT